MSERQLEIYKFIVEYVKQHLYAPSLLEICEYVGLKSVSTVSYHLYVLEKLGYIKVKIDTPRAISVVGYTLIKNESLRKGGKHDKHRGTQYNSVCSC